MSVEFETKCTCTECNSSLNIRVCKSAAGWYLGFICPKDGPYSRETVYMSKETAEDMLCSITGGS
jgi:hypothetical protein